MYTGGMIGEVFVYPWHDIKKRERVTAENFKAPKNWQFFYQHLMQNDRIRSVEAGDKELLSMTSRRVMKLIEAGGTDWEKWVPEEVHSIVRRMQSGERLD